MLEAAGVINIVVALICAAVALWFMYDAVRAHREWKRLREQNRLLDEEMSRYFRDYMNRNQRATYEQRGRSDSESFRS